jgi:hypothetical protein
MLREAARKEKVLMPGVKENRKAKREYERWKNSAEGKRAAKKLRRKMAEESSAAMPKEPSEGTAMKAPNDNDGATSHLGPGDYSPPSPDG